VGGKSSRFLSVILTKPQELMRLIVVFVHQTTA
jgi:hypothetical protein